MHGHHQSTTIISVVSSSGLAQQKPMAPMEHDHEAWQVFFFFFFFS
jgi:hypothetical protein